MDNVTTTGYLFIIAVVLIFFIYVGIYIFNQIRVSPESTLTIFKCAPGLCATSILNGEKRCPQSQTDGLMYNPEFETCNSRGTCESTVTPFAVLGDGSTTISGICDQNTICRCLRVGRCGTQTNVLFEMIGGSTLAQNAGSTSFTQIPKSFQGSSELLEISKPNSQFCSIKPYHLNRVVPGGCVFRASPLPSTQDLQNCFNRNPCVVGVLAYVPPNTEEFDNSSLTQTNVGCVTGKVCNPNEFAVWNGELNSVFCYNSQTGAFRPNP